MAGREAGNPGSLQWDGRERSREPWESAVGMSSSWPTKRSPPKRVVGGRSKTMAFVKTLPRANCYFFSFSFSFPLLYVDLISLFP